MSRVGLRTRVAMTALLVAYVAFPNSHHALLPGIPLTIAGAVAMLLVAVHHGRSAGRLRDVVIVGVLIGAKAMSAVTLPASGFQALYFGNPRFEGESYRTTDRVIDFDGRTFRREFLIDFRLQTDNIDALPFSVRWRGWVASGGTALRTQTVASAPAVVLVDGAIPPDTPSRGTHEIVVSFPRTTPEAPQLRVSVTDGRAPISVFAAPVSLTGARLAGGYASMALVLDLVILGMLGCSARLSSQHPQASWFSGASAVCRGSH